MCVSIYDAVDILFVMHSQHQANMWFAFRSELTIMMASDHPAIPRLFGVMSDPVTHSYSLVCARAGASLFSFLRGQSPVPRTYNAFTWSRQIASGVAYLHSLGIVHRELKSSVILLSIDASPQCIITGFGCVIAVFFSEMCCDII